MVSLFHRGRRDKRRQAKHRGRAMKSSLGEPHCLTKNLLLDSSPTYLHLKWFLTLQQGRLLAYVPLHNERKLLFYVH
jgi:hypothetical protein